MARILIVDDDETVLDLEQFLLVEAGHDVLQANGALLALDILALYEVDLVIVDILMPRFDGLQFVSTIKNNPTLNKIPIAFLSSTTEKDKVMKAAKLGADFYLMKPIDGKSFLKKISSFFQKNPPKEHPKIEYQHPPSLDLKIHHPIQVLSISDLGVEAVTNEELAEGQVAELPSSLFHEALPDGVLFKVLWIKPRDDGFKRVFLAFLGRDLEVVRKLQKYVQARSGGASLQKYSKTL